MNENINLCEILKEHEGETFYSPIFGNIKLISVKDNTDFPILFVRPKYDIPALFTEQGYYAKDSEECILFPSKDQRDWNKWVEEQNKKTPKTWNELVNTHKYETCGAVINAEGYSFADTSIEKSALAMLKIHQLIEVGYGGNVTNEEWYDDLIPKFIIIEKAKGVFTDYCVRKENYRTPIAFYKSSQAEEFLSYPENVQLLKDYFMINN